MENAVEIVGLEVVRGKRLILKGLTLSLAKGSVTGLLGPSSSGKTTLMRAIAGVQKIRSGQVTILGEPAGSARLRRQLGYMTQAPSIYPDLTVRENARYFASLYGLTSAEAGKAIADVGLSGAADQLIATLSGGQRARASLGCTLVGNPLVLVLDEPTVGQDPILRRELWQQFRALAQTGATLIISSHVMDEARRCDRVLFINEGRLLAADTPEAIMARANTDDLDEAFLRLVLAERGEGMNVT